MKTNFEKWKEGLTLDGVLIKRGKIAVFGCDHCPAYLFCVKKRKQEFPNPFKKGWNCMRTFKTWANTEAEEETTPPDTNWEAHAIFQDICDLLKEVDALAERLGIDLSADESEFVHPLGGAADRLFEARAFMAEFLNDLEATK